MLIHQDMEAVRAMLEKRMAGCFAFPGEAQRNGQAISYDSFEKLKTTLQREAPVKQLYRRRNLSTVPLHYMSLNEKPSSE